MENRTRILLVDDDVGLTAKLGAFLGRNGYQVAAAVNGEDALGQIGPFAPHLIVLDIEMPFMDGREFLRRLRRAGNWTPVIMLTIVAGAGERAITLDEGADDYMTKHFEYNELLSRIRAVLRRVRPGQAPLAWAEELSSGELRLNRRAHTVSLRGRPLTLSPRAVYLLEYLMTHPLELLSRERLIEVVWDMKFPANDRVVDKRIAELRGVLGDDAAAPRLIETVSSAGYRFIGEVEVIP